MGKYYSLNDSMSDILRELGNIGSGKAATALSDLMGHAIGMEIPAVNIRGFEQVSNILGGSENTAAGVLMDLSGDIRGMFMFLCSESFFRCVMKGMLGTETENIYELDEMSLSAFKEIGNIMCCCYISALAEMLDITIDVSVPDINVDMVGALVSVPMIRIANVSDEFLFIETEISTGGLSEQGYVLFFPEQESLEKIAAILEEKYEK